MANKFIFCTILALCFLIQTVKGCSFDSECGLGGCCYSGACQACGYDSDIKKLVAAYILFAIGGILLFTDIIMCCCLCCRSKPTVIIANTTTTIHQMPGVQGFQGGQPPRNDSDKDHHKKHKHDH